MVLREAIVSSNALPWFVILVELLLIRTLGKCALVINVRGTGVTANRGIRPIIYAR
jgi:hypothetical protein